MKFTIQAACAAAALLLIPVSGHAHFILHEPASWQTENQLGDPQKLAPCGGTTAVAPTPTGIVSAVRGGDMIHIKVQETVFHPGHYRVTLVTDRKDLPADPMVMTKDGPKGPISVSTMIQAKPAPPVLADGLWPHTEKPAPMFWETDLKLPNINCEKCTLQVVQFMAEHGHNNDGDYSYHHCADLKITANPKLPMDKGWAAAKAPK